MIRPFWWKAVYILMLTAQFLPAPEALIAEMAGILHAVVELLPEWQIATS
jgi:hypothetical protein